jgi:uncharacterized protein YbcI
MDIHGADHPLAEPPATGDQPLLASVSNDMVRLYKELFGRGPRRARSNFAGPDTLICTLEDTFTPAERRLVELGEHERLRESRTFFQYASTDEFIAVAERHTGRSVRAFISGIDVAKDVACEVFVFDDAPDPVR